MKIRIISATTSEGLIGNEKGLPWDVPDEYQHYLDTVNGQTVIMGRKSFEIFGKDLLNTTSIIISRNSKAEYENRAADLTEAIDIARGLGREIFIAGGASIYREALAIADMLHLSEIKGQFEGDVYFPDWNKSAWKQLSVEDHKNWTYRVYERR